MYVAMRDYTHVYTCDRGGRALS